MTAQPKSVLAADGVRSAAKTSPFYIQATSPLADEHARVLKRDETFAVFDHYGDIKPVGLGEEGIYHEGTRFLSCYVLALESERPMFLSSTVKEDNDLLIADLTNPDFQADDRPAIPRGVLHLSRAKFLRSGVCYERIRLKNYGLMPIRTAFALHYEADFADIFEVRGNRRPRRGDFLEPAVEAGRVILAYRGLDGVVRRTRLEFSPAATTVAEADAIFEVTLQPSEESTFIVQTICEIGDMVPALTSFDEALRELGRTLSEARKSACRISTSNEPFNNWLGRTVSDLHMMVTHTPQGPYPYAGVPWYSTAFGRDGIVTALECLWMHPGLARGVLAYLAATQANEVNPEQDAEPGKILHETRKGEMAALHEIPFGRYYGSVDSTPLFIMLAGAYYERTSDREFLSKLWPHVERALEWIDVYGDADHDGFVEYARTSSKGLIQQGWKDSHDSVFHSDGTLAKGPIALCEVQGYVFAARLAAAQMAAVLGYQDKSARFRQQAEDLREQFEKSFWCEDLSTYALALDGEKRPCRVRTSNAGHCLMTGIANRTRAARVALTLVDEHSFSGWGIRTLSAGEVRYNPMSYHNGSIWPHDNAMIAIGMARYGLKDAVLRVLDGLFDASIFLDLHRLPELFCGFPRRPEEGPTLYPVACAPQSWAAVSVFALLQACLGLRINAPDSQICFEYPLLPPTLREVRIHNLRVGDACVDFLLIRHDRDVGINVQRREGRVEIVMVK
jgi:glycogen debranching enzyme